MNAIPSQRQIMYVANFLIKFMYCLKFQLERLPPVQQVVEPNKIKIFILVLDFN